MTRGCALAAALLVAAGTGEACEPRPVPRAVDPKRALTAELWALVVARYPDFAAEYTHLGCAGAFGGSGREEYVLGVRTFDPATKATTWARVGLVWHGSTWQVHDIDAELRADTEHKQQDWDPRYVKDYPPASMLCTVDPALRDVPDLVPKYGPPPLFDLAVEGLAGHAPVCFSTSDVYNNWDCIVYDDNLGHFRLWYRQEFAD